MKATIRPGRIQGTVRAPASKSHTHRAFILAALSGNGSIRNALQSDDTQATLDVLQGLGMLVTQLPHETRVGGTWRAPRGTLSARASGTTLRLMTGVASTQAFATTLDAEPQLRRRPMGPLLEALKALGVETRSDAGTAPVSVRGPLHGGDASLPGNVSSQFTSALLLAAPLASAETRLRIEGPRVSEPYVEITLHQLREHGVRVDATADGYRIPPDQRIRQRPYEVPGDYSSAAFLLAAAAVTRGRVTVTGLSESDPQGDRAILEHLQAFGASVEPERGAVTVEGAPLHAARIDVGACPDLFPVLCAVAAVASGRSVLHGAPHLRSKESDRIRAMAANLSAAGVRTQERSDGIEIEGGIPKGITIDGAGDHRIGMAMAVLALAATGASTVPDTTIFDKSYPKFLNDLSSIAAEVARA